jgi:DNA-binding transcriptional ArsR family regulator
MESMRSLRNAGVSVHASERVPASGDFQWDAILEVAAGDGPARSFAVHERGRAPYPNELWRLDPARRDALRREARPLLVVPFVSEPLGGALTEAGWSWADAQGNFDLRAPGLTLRQRRTASAPKPRRSGLPQGSGSLAIIRALIRFASDEGEEPGASALAVQAGVSQPRASQVLAQLRDLGLVERSQRGRWIPRREALLDRFLAEYRGPGGSERYFYTLDAPIQVAVRAALAEASEGTVAVSADVGPDLLAAWRRPTIVILYTTDAIDEEVLGLVEAQGPGDANVFVREPADRSVFRDRPLVARVDDVDIHLADESQLIWDLQELGGADRLEAAGVLREWLLTR